MNNSAELANVRRESLCKIAKICIRAVAGSLLCICIALAIAITGIILLYRLGIDLSHSRANEPVLPVALFFLAIVIAATVLGPRAEAIIETAIEEAANYDLPPVSAEILPSEAILLRGSQVSLASPQELLRPVGKQDTPAEELLRAGEE